MRHWWNRVLILMKPLRRKMSVGKVDICMLSWAMMTRIYRAVYHPPIHEMSHFRSFSPPVLMGSFGLL